MITPQDMTRETRELPDLSVEVRVGLRLEEVRWVPWSGIRLHDVGHVAGGHPVLAAIREAEDSIMRRLYGPAEHLWDVAAGLTAALQFVRKKFLPAYQASERVTVPEVGPATLTPPQWPEEYRAFRALLLESGLALGLRWSAAGDKFVPQTGDQPTDTTAIKSPSEWEKQTGITVMDHGGWRDKSYDDPISKEDFLSRCMSSRCQIPREVMRELIGVNPTTANA